jgi:hypothetical protein
MEMFERRMDERLAKAREADALRIADLEAKLAAATKETFECSGCGRVCGSLAGKLAHERSCEVLNPTEG